MVVDIPKQDTMRFLETPAGWRYYLKGGDPNEFDAYPTYREALGASIIHSLIVLKDNAKEIASAVDILIQSRSYHERAVALRKISDFEEENRALLGLIAILMLTESRLDKQ